MCGRFTLRRAEVVRKFFDIHTSIVPGFEEFTERPRFNIAPSQHVPVVRLNSKGERTLSLVRWGLIPSWTKGKPKVQPINARAETVDSGGMFRQAFERRRCLVPIDGFYEWRKNVDGSKQPMFIHHEDDTPFALAGLWERWSPDENADPIDTMTIVTTTPNSLMASIHDRMPVILAERDYARWLDRDVSGSDVVPLLKPYEGSDLKATPVSPHVNSPRNDDPRCVEAVNENA